MPTIKLKAVALGIAAVLATATLAAQPSVASGNVYGTMNDSGGLYWRSGPDYNTAIQRSGYGVYPGTYIAISCYQMGAANVPGSSDAMWVQASWSSGPGTGSGWINEHFVNDGQPINHAAPGIPACTSGGGGGSGSSAASTAINWARQHLGQNFDSGLCLQFVAQAYQAAGIGIGSAATAASYWSSDPRGYARHPGDKNPAVGSLVFWGATSANSAGHVGIYEGNNTVISTSSWPESGSQVHEWSFSGRNAAGYPYLGWLMP